MTSATSDAPELALAALADQLRDEDSVISPFVTDPGISPGLGLLAAAGPCAREARAEYALLVECVREGYLLHYGEGRVVAGVDPNLALLAGDYLYARGLERLAGLGDIDAVGELSDLISLLAQLHVRDDPPAHGAEWLWLAGMVAVAVGRSEPHERAKTLIREQRPEGIENLAAVAIADAECCGLQSELAIAVETVGLKKTDLDDFG